MRILVVLLVLFVAGVQISRAVGRLLGVSPAELTEALGSSRGIVFVARRSPQACSFVVLARDAAQIDGLIAGIPQFEIKLGVCQRID